MNSKLSSFWSQFMRGERCKAVTAFLVSLDFNMGVLSVFAVTKPRFLTLVYRISLPSIIYSFPG